MRAVAWWRCRADLIGRKAHYNDSEFRVYVELMCATADSPTPGRFASVPAVRAVVGKAYRALLAAGDLVVEDDGSVTVTDFSSARRPVDAAHAERQRRYEARRKSQHDASSPEGGLSSRVASGESVEAPNMTRHVDEPQLAQTRNDASCFPGFVRNFTPEEAPETGQTQPNMTRHPAEHDASCSPLPRVPPPTPPSSTPSSLDARPTTPNLPEAVVFSTSSKAVSPPSPIGSPPLEADPLAADDFDLLDVYFDLTRSRPWGTGSGKWLTRLQNEFTFEVAAATLRAEWKVDPTTHTILGRVSKQLSRARHKREAAIAKSKAGAKTSAATDYASIARRLGWTPEQAAEAFAPVPRRTQPSPTPSDPTAADGQPTTTGRAATRTSSTSDSGHLASSTTG